MYNCRRALTRENFPGKWCCSVFYIYVKYIILYIGGIMLQSITLNVQCIERIAQFSSLLPRFSLKCWSNSHLWPVTLLQCQDWPSRTHCWLLGVFDYLNQFVMTQSNCETIFSSVFVYFLRSKRVGCGHLEVGCGHLTCHRAASSKAARESPLLLSADAASLKTRLLRLALICQI